ncbi:Cysteine protease ATG4B [Acorus calamus]|uniref:Cysteine protease n=1 Tax=Acorus calamus TaxID=4465 RepID=A0AAV9E9S9_ACOCL|nr:Cysteine protease ATG4B [Acorus calamus]
MTDLPERAVASSFSAETSTYSADTDGISGGSEKRTTQYKPTKAPSWPSFFASTLSVFESYTYITSIRGRESKTGTHGWMTAVKRAASLGPMRRFQERILGVSKSCVSSSASEIWLLGSCYRVSHDDSSSDAESVENDIVAFHHDFSSRIWLTYRKGFDAIGDFKLTSDVNWGCMIRSSQMLVAQAILFHRLGRFWRRPSEKPHDPEYIDILHLFGDSESSPFSIHNLLHAGRPYGLVAGSWVGPYAMCRSWETLSRDKRDHVHDEKEKQPLPMVLYVVSGDEDGARGGAPVIYREDAELLCSEFCDGQVAWAPLLLLIPLVLGLEKINPRYVPLLKETFTFPQSLGILGGKPGASTYIVGVQDNNALYLDPHENQPVVEIARDNLEADTSTYHCNVVRQLPLDTIDPSLAIGFYCRDRDDFERFCARASELADKSGGAPLFTVAQSLKPAKPVHKDIIVDNSGEGGNSGIKNASELDNSSSYDHVSLDDDWQLL